VTTRSVRHAGGRDRSWARAFLCFSLAFVAPGCGLSENTTTRGVKGSAKAVKEADLYRYEGTGRSKRKEPVSRRERIKKLREAGRNLPEGG